MAFTFFFRDAQTLNLAIDHFLPFVQSRRSITIWSAGCAMGQEPYTFAILLRERMGPYLFRNVKIFATDIDTYNQYVQIIGTGRYPEKDLQRIPPEIFQAYFRTDPQDPGYVYIADEIRNAVEFKKHDLLTFEPIRTGIHMIICKNVLLHFSAEERLQVWKMFWNALEYGGFMLHEHTQKLPEELSGLFDQIVMNAQVFRKK
ncbi:MAG TPA: CheR family methyltransferase [Methanospirillum sp.]|uniref:CheR family methyltransferase n=1 Tax=Methanospirillum sp. TaxID=45200 RepID=UPI002BC37945|nr:CheR family methyltransferase [Methanospirillum sp.]HOJ96044.1 CheR family methyltransferase [Methanospirillum sp.]HOL40818.1 CheR family methyltransferase [Methanospirillum sp.]